VSVPLPASVLEMETEQLLERIARSRAERCSALEQAADAQVREILRSAHAEARSTVHRAIAEARARIEQGLKQAEARAELAKRRLAQEQERALLAAMWQDIEASLEAHWRDGVQRRAWWAAALAQAQALLPARAWRIEYGSLPDAERAELERRAREEGCPQPAWVQDGVIRGGLRIRAESACLDATAAGLLARRAEIEAAFLAECARDATHAGSPR